MKLWLTVQCGKLPFSGWKKPCCNNPFCYMSFFWSLHFGTIGNIVTKEQFSHAHSLYTRHYRLSRKSVSLFKRWYSSANFGGTNCKNDRLPLVDLARPDNHQEGIQAYRKNRLVFDPSPVEMAQLVTSPSIP